MGRTYNNIEEYIENFLNSIGIYHPHQLNVETISNRLGIVIHYIPYGSMLLNGHMFLDSRLSKAEQWHDFAHELCHAKWHEGDQALIHALMREYQEYKAENFAKHLCIPSFMLDKMSLPNHENEVVWFIIENFGVSKSLAKKRMDQYFRNSLSAFWANLYEENKVHSFK